MTKIKLVSGLILLLLVLSGCGGLTSEPTVPTDTPIELPAQQFEAYETGDYRIFYPIGWKLQREFTSDIASTTDVSFTSNVKELFYTPTIIVSRTDLGKQISSADFGVQMIQANEQQLLNYNQIVRQEIIVGGEPATLVIYEAKENPEDELIEFTQAYFVKNNLGFVVTGSRDIAGDDILAERIFDTVSSFRFL